LKFLLIKDKWKKLAKINNYIIIGIIIASIVGVTAIFVLPPYIEQEEAPNIEEEEPKEEAPNIEEEEPKEEAPNIEEEEPKEEAPNIEQEYLNIIGEEQPDEVNLQDLVDIGLAFFKGDQPLFNQGAPCSECHSLTSMGLSGNNLAPDLSKAFLEPPNWFQDIPDFKGDKDQLTNYLKGLEPSSERMRLGLQDKPLTISEIEALVELLIHASNQE